MSSPERWTAARPDSPAATAATPTAEQVIAGLRATSEGGADLVQLLTPEGERVAHPDFSIDIEPAQVRALYRDMVLVRRVDRESNALQRKGELGLWVPLLGQEAAQVGAGRAMQPQDMAFPSYREHGVAFCRGVDPTDLHVIVLERDRHVDLIAELRESGAHVHLIRDGDVAPSIAASGRGRGVVDMLMGIGGTPEGVISAAAIKCIGMYTGCWTSHVLIRVQSPHPGSYRT